MGTITIRPADSGVWADLVTVFSTRGDPRRCWCQWFRLTPAQWRSSTVAQNRAALAEQAQAASDGSAPPPGVLAHRDGEPVGWCAVGPRTGYPRLQASPSLRPVSADLADPAIWAVTCFVVRTEARGQGVSAGLLSGALDLARGHGARVAEAYPVDVAATARPTASGLYHGALSVFLAAGFAEVARTSPGRPIVRLSLQP